jgi:hypothetical protein
VVAAARHNRQEAPAMKRTTIGLDLAKEVFQVHGIDASSSANGSAGATW